jgi:hypothetical protein
MSDPTRTERRLLASIRTAKGAEAQDSGAQPAKPAEAASGRPASKAAARRGGGTPAKTPAATAPSRPGGPAVDSGDPYRSEGRVWPD